MTDADSTGFTYILPYLEQDNVYNLYHFDSPWYDDGELPGRGIPLKIFFCPTTAIGGSWI